MRYDWAEDGRSIRSRSFRVEEGARDLEFESTLSWQPERQQIRFAGRSAAGETVEGVVKARAGLIEFSWQDRGVAYRQVLRFSSPDEHSLTAFEGSGESSRRLTTMTFKRRREE